MSVFRAWVAVLAGAWILFAQLSARAQGDSSQAQAEPPTAASATLGLHEVLASVQEHHPVLRAEIEAVRAAAGQQTEVRGVYDPTLEVKASMGPVGYYDYNALDATISQLTPLWGAEVYAGYRVQGQNLPYYYGEFETLSRGEVRAGLNIPLWKDRSIDEARAGRRRADADLDAAEGRRGETLLSLWTAAAEAYYAWSAALQDLEVQRDLLSLAQTRIEQVRGKVESGAVPPIEELDNRRALLSREAKLIDARRKAEQAEVKLALFLRDADGRVRPPIGLQPEPLDLPTVPAGLDDPAHIERALDDHPVVARYQAELRALRTELALADNAVAPELDVQGQISKDYGDGDAEMQRALEPAVLRVGATLKMPLALREARGKRAAVSAKVRALSAKADYARDSLRARALAQASALRNAIQRAERARQAAEVAEQLAEGERRRFELGATTLIWVTLREKTAADAQIDAIHAVAEARVALAAYRTALAQKPL